MGPHSKYLVTHSTRSTLSITRNRRSNLPSTRLARERTRIIFRLHANSFAYISILAVSVLEINYLLQETSLAIDSMAVEKRLRPEEEPSIKRHLIDINATPELESHQPLHKEKPKHYLSLVKPQMMQQVLSFRGSREERKASSMSNHSHTKRCGEGQSMELFSQHPGFATTKSMNTSESAHKLQGRSLITRSGVGGVQSPASRSASPAPTLHRQSSTQLTVFYKGTVNAFDIPADKAQAIMNMMAGNRNAHRLDSHPNFGKRVTHTATSVSSGSPPIWKAAPTNEQKEVSIALPIPAQLSTAQSIKEIENLHEADPPLSRKQSLQRFLEKRQTRLKSVAPYTTNCVNSWTTKMKMGGTPVILGLPSGSLWPVS